MMKRLVFAFIPVLLVLPLIGSGVSETRIVDNRDREKEIAERLNLRRTASISGDTIGSFYTGTEVTLARSGEEEGYLEVEVGGLSGFMSGEFLVTPEQFAASYGSDAARGQPAEIDLTGLWTAAEPLRSSPQAGDNEIAELPDGSDVRALGFVGNWAYISAQAADKAQEGYVRLLTLAESGDGKTAIIMGSDAEGGIVMRSAPQAKAEEVMIVQNGTACILLFGRSSGWYRVRVGSISGWIQNETGENMVFLNGAPRSSVPFYPPLMQTSADTLLYREAGNKEDAYLTLGEGMKVEVLGVAGDYDYVRTLEGGAGAFDSGDFGFVDGKLLVASTSSASIGVAQADDSDLPVLLYTTPDKEGRVVGALIPGAEVRILAYTQTEYVQLILGEMVVYAQKKCIRLLTSGNDAPSDRIPQRAVVRQDSPLISEPADSAEELSSVSAEARVYMLAKCGDWAFVNAGGSSHLDVSSTLTDALGFVRIDRLNAPAGTTHLIANVTTDKVNMRERANRTSPIIGKARLGELLRVADYGSSWTCVVKEDGTRGYIMTEYLNFE